MLAISVPGGGTMRSWAPARPVIRARRSIAQCGLVIVMIPGGACLVRGRSRRTGRHLVDPDRESESTDGRNRERRHENRGQEQEGEDFHAPPAHSFRHVVASDRHAFSSSNFGILTASRPSPFGKKDNQKPANDVDLGQTDVTVVQTLDFAEAANRLKTAIGGGSDVVKFGIFYELQLPRPWLEGDELRLYQDALTQLETADRLGYDYAW